MLFIINIGKDSHNLCRRKEWACRAASSTAAGMMEASMSETPGRQPGWGRTVCEGGRGEKWKRTQTVKAWVTARSRYSLWGEGRQVQVISASLAAPCSEWWRMTWGCGNTSARASPPVGQNRELHLFQLPRIDLATTWMVRDGDLGVLFGSTMSCS